MTDGAALTQALSSPVSQHVTEDLAYYKSQYEQLEAELADFQQSSKELETELEKDVEAAEKRERQVQQRVEALGYEVEEWKTKYKHAKTEANNAQNVLQKEVTSLRETNRTISLKLRDIEVSNDDMERQARNTTSSLEDMELKLNTSIERGVIAEEDIRAGEQERESLRIETQRLRDDLNDLKVEAEIRQDKLRNAEAVIQSMHAKSIATVDLGRPQSPLSEPSPTTSYSNSQVNTPPTRSTASTVSEAPTTPSPPTSDKSIYTPIRTPSITLPKSRLSMKNPDLTPRALPLTSRAFRASRGPHSERPAGNRLTSRAPLPRTNGAIQSGSLQHLHGLMDKMSMLEQRVQSVRSKLPAPVSTPPRASPRSVSSSQQSSLPAGVTVRSNRKRTGGSIASASTVGSETPSSRLSSAYSHVDRPSSRLSFGIPQPSPQRESAVGRPPSRDGFNQSTTRSQQSSRPGSRAGLSSRQSMSHLSSSSRPASRQSLSGARTPLGSYSTSTIRPTHGHSASVSRIASYEMCNLEDESGDVVTPTPSRRVTTSRNVNTPSTIRIPSTRISGIGVSKRMSMGREMAPPQEKKASSTTASNQLTDVGESY